MPINSDYIDLNRQFSLRDNNANAEDLAVMSCDARAWSHRSTLNGWDKIIDAKGVAVILGEPGSGRTWEFHAQAQKLLHAGQTAFFVQLQHLIGNQLNALIDSDESQPFRSWLQSSDEAVFFLDAVDEAKLNSVADFEAALRHFRQSIGAQGLERSTVLISCRVHQWDHTADSERIRTYLRLPEDKPSNCDDDEETAPLNEKKQLQVWLLHPLDEERIALYAKHRKALHVDEFIDALKRHHCWDYAGRPYDVDFLLGFWERHGGLAKLATMLDELVERQLEEDKADNIKKSPLGREKARLGAESLAAASLFCRKLDFFPLSIRYPVEDSALEMKRCLKGDWTDMEINALADRPIFSAPSFGRVRFQHRRTTEFLAACWVRRLMAEVSSVELKHLFFAEHRGRLAVRESRAPVVAWLAGLSEEPWALELRNLLLRTAPHVFFRYGDPSSLPFEYKETIVDAFISYHEHQDAVRTKYEAGSLSRLADEAMATSLSRHLNSATVLPGVKITLLKMAAYGRVTGCVEAALGLIGSNANRGDLPSYALWVIEECADREQKQKLATILEASETLSPSFVGSVLEILFPEIISVDQLENLIKKAATSESLSDSSLRWHTKQIFCKLESKKRRLETLVMCMRLLAECPHLPETTVSSRFAWIGDSLAPLLQTVLEEPSLDDAEVSTASRVICLLKQRHYRTDLFVHDVEKGKKFDLQELTRRHPETRRQAFWLNLEAESRKPHPEQDLLWRGHFALEHLGFTPVQEDWQWMLTDLTETKNSRDRETLFYLCYNLWRTLSKKRDKLKILKLAVKDDPKLSTSLRQHLRGSFFSPWHQFWAQQKRQGVLNKRWWKHRAHDLSQFKDEFIWQCRLHFRLKHLREGKSINWLRHIILADLRTSLRITPKDWTKLRQRYGKLSLWLGNRIVNAAQSGCVKIWESYTPDLNYKTYGGEIGMVGIQILHDSAKLQFGSLNHNDARKAACYATQEINGFPDWFSDLAEQQPDAVRSVLVELLTREWNMEIGEKHYPDFISRLSSEKCSYSHLVVSEVLTRLRGGDPSNHRVLEHAVLFLIRHGNLSMEEWSGLAHSRVSLYLPDEQQYELWLSLWLQSDAQAAINFLETVLPPPQEADRMTNPIVVLCAGFQSRIHHAPVLPEESYRHPTNAEKFIRLVYNYVVPSDDLHRIGGYSPVARDDAQHFRGNLLTPLALRPEPEADEALSNLAAAPELAEMRDYILGMIDERAERMADIQSWSTEEFRAFAEDRECMPFNLDDLFHVVQRRIEGIKHDVEDAEESIRDEMNASRNEAGLQSFLVRKLRERNNGRYTAPKEPQIDGAQRPDIQIHRAGIGGHVQIEAKLGDMESRYISSLLSDLERQLLDQYMRDQHSTHGIFLVGFSGKGKRTTWQDPETRQQVGFEEVIARLEARASELQANAGNRKKLKVFGIDFRERV